MENDQADIYTMSRGMDSLKFISGMAQMIFATMLLAVNTYFLQDSLIEYGCYGTFAFGFFLVGVRHQTKISPSKKFIELTRGFLFFVSVKKYSRPDFTKVLVRQSTNIGTDSNGIGLTRKNTTVFSYHVELALTNGGTQKIHSGSKRREMEQFAKRIANIFEVPFATGVSSD